MLNPCFFSKISFPLWFLTEIARIQSGGKPPGRDSKFVDIYHEKPIRLTVRALVPVKEHPKVSVSLLNLEEIWKLLISQFSTRERKSYADLLVSLSFASWKMHWKFWKHKRWIWQTLPSSSRILATLEFFPNFYLHQMMTYSWKKGDQKVWKLPKMSPFSSKYVKRKLECRIMTIIFKGFY